MAPHTKTAPAAAVRAAAYTSGGAPAPPEGEGALALLALSHTPAEHLIYESMLAEVCAAGVSLGAFSARRLMSLTGIYDYTKVRRALAGLRDKLSIEQERVAGDAGAVALYRVYAPEEVFARRAARGLAPYPAERAGADDDGGRFCLAVERAAERYRLSRREAEVALSCAEGLTNAEIGARLSIGVQTVKFHMRHVLAKFGVRRRTELVSQLLRRELGREGEGAL